MPEASAPDLFSSVFQWHGKYLPPRLQGERLLLVSENETLALGSAGVLALQEPLQRGVSLAEYCASAGTDAPLAQMLHALGALLRQGLVRPVAEHAQDMYLRPDFSAPPTRLDAAAGVDVVLLTAALDAAAAQRWAAELIQGEDGSGGAAAEAGLTVVYCDDYLDPRLAAIDAQQRACGRPWLLVRPAGEQAMAGPLFATRTDHAPPCWHCLAHRWRRNHPSRTWGHSHPAQEDVCPPVRADAALVGARLQQLQATARHMLAHTDAAPAVWTLSPRQRHCVTRRPQCPHCAAPQRMAQQQRERIMPAPHAHAVRCDGGWRSMPAAATVERLLPHVSPLTGVIARVVPLTAESGAGLTVYRSEIFKTPDARGGAAHGAWTQLCLGKGLSAEQARASAMCEAIERYAAFYQGDEAAVFAPAAQLDARSIAPASLACFSDAQRDRFAIDKPPHAVARQIAAAEPAWWTPAWSLTADERCYLPLGFCLAHAPAQSQSHVTWTSNGCAAGNTMEEAILQGFLELVERDAAAIWWYGQVRRPAVALDSLAEESRQRLEHACGAQWSYWLLDITHDFGIPVVVAVGRHRTHGQWAVGFGCSPDRSVACERAMTEISQLIAAGKSFAVASGQAPHHPQDGPAFLYPLEDADAAPLRIPGHATPQITQTITHCVGIARELGLETLVYDYSRPDIPLRTVKVVVPGLCHIWPELGNPRLRTVPAALGWCSACTQDGQLNPQALYV